MASSNYHPFADRYQEFLRMGETRWPAYLNWHDQGATWWQWEPAAPFFSRAFRSGIVPLWDSTIAGGVDAHVNVTQGQYFPPYLAVLLAGNGEAVRDAYYLLMLLGSGMCVFLLFHRNRLHPLACATAAVAWMLGGSMTMNINSIIGQSIAVLPLMLLVMEWFLDAPSPPRAAGLAAAVATAVLSSFLPVVIAGLALIAIQLVVHVAMAAGRRLAQPPHARALVLGAAGIAAGLAAAAFLLVPMVVASRADLYFSTRYPGTGSQHYAAAMWPGLLSRVVPFSVTQGNSPYPAPGGDLNIFDIGLVPVLLALLTSRRGSPNARRLLAFFLIGGGYILARLFGVPPVHWVGFLPVFREVHFVPYGCPALALAVGGLAAMGVDDVVRRGVTRRRAAVVTVVVVALIDAGLWFAATHRLSDAPALHNPGFEGTRLALLGLLVVAVLWMRAGGVLGGRAAGALLLVAVGLELAPLARVDRFQRAPVWTDVPPYVRALQKDNSRFRVLSTDGLALVANVHQAFGIDGVGSRHAINPWRYSRLIRTYFPTALTVYPVPTGLLPSQRVVLDLLNVKYLIVHVATPAVRARLKEAGLKPFLTDGTFEVLYNPTVWPRAYLAGRHTVVPSFDAAVAAVGKLETPYHVILEERPLAAVDGGKLDGAESQIREYRGGHVRIQTLAPRAAILVLTDNFADGWTATVNGQPARILAANAAFRAVEVPAGEADVVFRYVTPGLYAGLGVSGVAVAVLVGLALWPLAQRRRSQMLPPGLRSQSGMAP